LRGGCARAPAGKWVQQTCTPHLYASSRIATPLAWPEPILGVGTTGSCGVKGSPHAHPREPSRNARRTKSQPARLPPFRHPARVQTAGGVLPLSARAAPGLRGGTCGSSEDGAMGTVSSHRVKEPHRCTWWPPYRHSKRIGNSGSSEPYIGSAHLQNNHPIRPSAKPHRPAPPSPPCVGAAHTCPRARERTRGFSQ